MKWTLLSALSLVAGLDLCQAPKEYIKQNGDLYYFEIKDEKMSNFQRPGEFRVELEKPMQIKSSKKVMRRCRVKPSEKFVDGWYAAYGRIRKNKFEPLTVPQQVKYDQVSGKSMCGIHLSKCPASFETINLLRNKLKPKDHRIKVVEGGKLRIEFKIGLKLRKKTRDQISVKVECPESCCKILGRQIISYYFYLIIVFS